MPYVVASYLAPLSLMNLSNGITRNIVIATNQTSSVSQLQTLS
jgi:hypothetical protein